MHWPRRDGRGRWINRDNVTSLGSAATALAGLLYGYGWVILFQFYGHFGISPEDVGVTFSFVTVRIAFLVAAVFVVAALLALALKPLGRLHVGGRSRQPAAANGPAGNTANGQADAEAPPENDTRFWITWVVGSWAGAFLVGALLLAGLDAVGLMPAEGTRTYEVFTTVIGGAVVFAPGWLLVLLFVYDAIEARLPKRGFSFEPLAGVLRIGLWLVVVGSLLVAAWWVPRQLIGTVERGVAPTSVPFVSVLGLRAETVQVTARDGDEISPRVGATRCLWFFGAANGVTVLYDPEQQVVARVPTDRVVIERPCA